MNICVQSEAARSFHSASGVHTRKYVDEALFDYAKNCEHGEIRDLLASSPSIPINIHFKHRGAKALHVACIKGDRQTAEMLVSIGFDIWEMASEDAVLRELNSTRDDPSLWIMTSTADVRRNPHRAYLIGIHETPIELAWRNGHGDLVQHLFGMKESEPRSEVLDSLISNQHGAEVIRLFIQQFDTASNTAVSRNRAHLVRNIWQKISNRDERPKLEILAMIIRNRPERLIMLRQMHSRSQLEISAKNNLTLLVLYLAEMRLRERFHSWMKRIGEDAKSREPLFDAKELPALVAQYLHGSEENDRALIQEPHCAFEEYDVLDYKVIKPSLEDPLKKVKAPFLSLNIPFLGQAMAIFNNENSTNWHTLDESRIYAWYQEDIRSWKDLTDKSGSMGLHAYCSLDEYCFPHLSQEVLAQRNADQTLTRYQMRPAKEVRTTSEKAAKLFERNSYTEADRRLSVPLIIVPQALMWVVDDLLIIALPLAPPRNFWTLLDYFRGVEVNEVIGLLLYAIVEAFEPGSRTKSSLRSLPNESNKDQSIFKVFSRSIASASDQVSKYFQDQNVDNITAIREHHYIHQILDIREEISMMQSIIAQQEEVWRIFVSNAWPQFYKEGVQGAPTFEYKSDQDDKYTDITPGLLTSNNPRLRKELFEAIGKPQHVFTRLKQRLQRLDDDAARVERSIELRLDLKQKHASLREARKATLMSASVIGFTLITAIFTPLSFMVGLFALPIDHFQTNKVGSGDDAYYTTNYIGKWIACAEIVTLCMTLLAMGIAAIWISGTKKHEAMIRGIKEYAIQIKAQIKSEAGTGRLDETGPSMKIAGTISGEPEDLDFADGPHNASRQGGSIRMERSEGDNIV